MSKFYLVMKYQFRNKSNIISIILISLIMFLMVLIGSYRKSASSFLNKEAHKLNYLRKFTVDKNEQDLKNENRTWDDVRKELNSVEHIINVAKGVSYANGIHSKELETDKMSGYVWIISSNNKALPKIVEGTNFSGDETDEIICPINFYPTDYIDGLKYKQRKDRVNLEDKIGKYITFDYVSHNQTKKFGIKLKLVGLYENAKSEYDENECYVKEDVLKKIAVNQYVDDIDQITGINNITLQTSFIIEIDNIDNVKMVKEKLKNLGYYLSEMGFIVEDFFNDIFNKTNHLISYLSFMMFVFVLIVLQLKHKKEKR